ncbi:RluA family pseudouridine synthase [Spiroplasma endosymbiont of Othius punctulatus]|uniref:RluA family pseudouridine synthase n=1 Tax=Spiroplasma endosymbiont of Othius punctulatus TaxID=3066289 RepID=UPI0030CEAA74
MIEYTVNTNDEGQTIFKFVKKVQKDMSLSIIYKLFRTGNIKINNKKVKEHSIILQVGDNIKIYSKIAIEQVRDEFVSIPYKDLKIVFEDTNILIADKPSNLEVHSDINDSLDLMVKSYLFKKKEYQPDKENSFVVSHIHRIDKLTKGLVIYAKNKKALDYFLEVIKDKEKIEKRYIARLEKIYKGPNEVKGFMRYDSEIQKSIFSLEFIEEEYGLKSCEMSVEFRRGVADIVLGSGRKHQIRAIMGYYNSPIEGDFRYGAKRSSKREIALVAKSVAFFNFDNGFEYLNNKSFVSKYEV